MFVTRIYQSQRFRCLNIQSVLHGNDIHNSNIFPVLPTSLALETQQNELKLKIVRIYRQVRLPFLNGFFTYTFFLLATAALAK